jgi:hypothetical protein
MKITLILCITFVAITALICFVPTSPFFLLGYYLQNRPEKESSKPLKKSRSANYQHIMSILHGDSKEQ